MGIWSPHHVVCEYFSGISAAGQQRLADDESGYLEFACDEYSVLGK